MRRFEELQHFVAVVETGSFTVAAERLGVAKSAVSRRISDLESRLDIQLLNRTTRQSHLTDTGRSFYARSVRILDDLEEAESAVQQARGELRGNLKIALPLSFSIRQLCEPIAEFARANPAVSLDLDLDDRRVDLVREGADLAIRIGHLEDSSLIARKLFDARTVVCAAPAYIEKHGAPEHPDALIDHECLIYSNLTDPDRWHYEDANGEQRRAKVNARIAVSNGDFLTAAAVHGAGIVLQPTFLAGDAMRRRELVPLLCDFRWPVSPAWAVYPPTRHLSYRVRALIEFLVERFAGTPPWDEDCESAGAQL